MSPWSDSRTVTGDGDTHVVRSSVLDAVATLCDRTVAVPYELHDPGTTAATCADCKRIAARERPPITSSIGRIL